VGAALIHFSPHVHVTHSLGFATQLGCATMPGGHTLLAKLTIKYLGIGVYPITIRLNVILTLTIVAKLLPSVFMSSRHSPTSKRALSVIGILAESAALYTVTGLAFAISLVTRSELQIIFGSLFGISVVHAKTHLLFISD
jgi:hypothetical protein